MTFLPMSEPRGISGGFHVSVGTDGSPEAVIRQRPAGNGRRSDGLDDIRSPDENLSSWQRFDRRRTRIEPDFTSIYSSGSGLGDEGSGVAGNPDFERGRTAACQVGSTFCENLNGHGSRYGEKGSRSCRSGRPGRVGDGLSSGKPERRDRHLVRVA